ncbi:MAG: hypothetical protein ACJKTH_02790 [Patescibacteria group bacterium UBA2163]
MKKNNPHNTLIIDIGTASLAGAVITPLKEGGVHMRSVRRMTIGSGDAHTREALQTQTLSSFKDLLNQYHTESVKKVVIVVAAPWHEAHIRTLHSSTKKTATITEETLKKAVRRYQNEVPPKEGSVDVEAVAMQVTVNGYPTNLEKSVLGNNIAINLYESEMHKKTQQDFIDAVHATIPDVPVDFNTFPLVSLVALRLLLEDQTFIVADVAGEATEVSVMQNDQLQYFASFPIGVRTIARDIAGSDGAINDTLSRLALLGRGELSSEENENITESYADAFTQWRVAFDEVLQAAAEQTPIPYTLVLLADKEPMSWFQKGFALQNTFNLHMHPVEPSLFQSSIELGDESRYDIFLSLIALFVQAEKTELIGDTY